MKHITKVAFGFLSLLLGIFFIGCGGSSGTSTTASSTSVNSIDDLPNTETFVATTATTSLNASLSKAVTGTPPLLTSISSSNADDYFWNGLLATITTAGSATQSQIDSYWDGEGACRMAQAVGYSFQNMLQGGTSLCYMQNMPACSNGVSITSGSATASTVFEQGASNKIVQVNVSGQGANETIFIKVFGTSTTEGASGYAADMFFCNSSNTVGGYEQIRLTGSTSFTSKSVHADFGNFVGDLTASLTTNASGQLIFDPSATRSATVYFGPTDGSFTFLGAVSIDSAGLLTAREYQIGSFGGGASQENKHAIFANFTGGTMDELRLLESSFALQDTYGSSDQSNTGATEYQTDHYEPVTSGTLLTTAQAEDFSHDVYTGSVTSQTADLAAITNYSCSTTHDVVVAMDFTASCPQAVAVECENNFQDMNFCDGTTVSAARDIVFTSQLSVFGSCASSYCGGDFDCQIFAEENPSNAQGITTANASCSNGCCAAQ